MTLLDLYDDYIKDYSKLVGVSKTKKTCDRYILTRKRVEEFMQSEYKRTDIRQDCQ